MTKSNFVTNFNCGKKAAALILRKAAQTIDEFGWTKGHFGDQNTGYCALGACMRARDIMGSDGNITRLARRALGLTVETSVPKFNDCIASKKEDITGPFRSAANRLEHGGTL